eukprot:2607562-Pleurochrysis_carterae.AAC.2
MMPADGRLPRVSSTILRNGAGKRTLRATSSDNYSSSKCRSAAYVGDDCSSSKQQTVRPHGFMQTVVRQRRVAGVTLSGRELNS